MLFCSPAKLIVYVNNKIININRNFFVSLSRHSNVLNENKGNQCEKSLGHLAYFLFSEGGCYIVQSQNLHYPKNTLRSYLSSMKTLPLPLCTHQIPCCTVQPLLIFGMACQVANDVTVSPESLSTCLTKTDKNLSSLLLLPSVADPYQRVNNSSSFRSLVTCPVPETALVSTSAVFVQPHRYLFTILGSGNMFLNSLAA